METLTTTHRDPIELRDAWRALCRADRVPRQRDAASELGVTEAQLVAAQCGDGAIRLTPRWLELVRGLEAVGPVMALTRNEHAVIEKDGVYSGAGGRDAMAHVIGPEIDLRLFLSHWHSGFALYEDGPRGVRRSVQFFDGAGTAVHKVFLRPGSQREAFGDLVRHFTDDDQRRAQAVRPHAVELARDDAAVDRRLLRTRWRTMRDTHEFVPMLRRLGASREQALRLAGDDLARPVGADALHRVLDRAAASALPIMVFVGNRGAIEIHAGPVERVVSLRGWLNVLDRRFNLHVRESAIARAWVVRKPSDAGDIHSLEVFSGDGDEIALLFAHRKAGGDVARRWQALLETL